MLLLFDSAADAVAYAIDYHRALAKLPTPLTARVGLHVGPVILRENTADDIARGAKPLEVEGLAKPIAARVMALARGGQTLLTADARDDLGASDHKLVVARPLDDQGRVRSDRAVRGRRRRRRRSCRRPTARRRIASSGWATGGCRSTRSRTTCRTRRPRSSAASANWRRSRRLLGSSRLLTLLGMGGLGKTRLSLQVAAEQIHDFPDGVWFLDLAPISDPALIVSEAAQVLGVREEPDRPLLQTLVRASEERAASC